MFGLSNQDKILIEDMALKYVMILNKLKLS